MVLVVGAITKRAQLPFSSWLPAAIAAPTPVSSLVHSSTLVVAGVYVLCRFNTLLSSRYAPLSVVSLSTLFLGGVCAIVELDFKKVVAISTLRQLGFMLYSLRCGLPLLCFLHMSFHAVFKSMLFFSTGRLIGCLRGGQDSRFFGSISDSFFVKIFFNISCLSLIGFPFLLGFYRKDSVAGNFLFHQFSLSSIVFFLGCCFTVSYRLRLIYINSFHSPTYSPSFSFSESSIFYLPIILLFLFCLFFGNFYMWGFMPLGVFSFFDLFVGILVISFGVWLFFIFFTNYVLSQFFSVLGFRSLVFSPLMSVKIFFVP